MHASRTKNKLNATRQSTGNINTVDAINRWLYTCSAFYVIDLTYCTYYKYLLCFCRHLASNNTTTPVTTTATTTTTNPTHWRPIQPYRGCCTCILYVHDIFNNFFVSTRNSNMATNIMTMTLFRLSIMGKCTTACNFLKQYY